LHNKYKGGSLSYSMEAFIRHALHRINLIRALWMMLLVGTIIGVINHYDMFLSGEFETRRIVQILVTYLVPFLVSLYSSAMSGRHHEKKAVRGF